MILVKTEMGHQVLKDRSVRLTPRQRSAFILFDGKRSVAEVLQASQAQQDDVDNLVSLGLLARPPADDAAPSPGAATGAAPAAAPTAGGERSAQARYQAAYPIATQLTASLGLRGFRLNLAVEAATTCEELLALVPKIRAAVGADKAAPLERALAP
ncbi:hypothetical protein [Xenophilus sp. Marseille-Q4582]|uniref:hypothetical protein n=1 Tax=Xenophilus sp. Marseille-Q4582 TaxID=2866600 RepID=UPI001CE449F5|nr:hypothetical protein [Xenophilus sp. Marseille-Q4582]